MDLQIWQLSTLTTIFAFLPMLTIVGDVGEYVSSLPVVVSATLGASYLIALLVTPIMCAWLLKAPGSDETPTVRETSTQPPFYDRLMAWCLEHKGITLGAALGTFVLSLSLLPIIGNQFFPAGTRDQFFVKVWLPEGSPKRYTCFLTKSSTFSSKSWCKVCQSIYWKTR